MVHSNSSNTTRTKSSSRKRTISESSSSESECKKWLPISGWLSFVSLTLVTASISTPIDFEDQIDRQSKELICSVHQAFKETIEVKRKDQTSSLRPTVDSFSQNFPRCQETDHPWSACMNQFKIYANRTVKFATRVPGFMNLHHVHDQVQLIRSSIHCIILLCLQHATTDLQWNYFNVVESKFHEQCQQLFPFIEYIRMDVEKIHTYLDSLKLDEKEFALFLSLLIVSTGNDHHHRLRAFSF